MTDLTHDTADALAPLTQERVIACLEARGLTYGIDDDGDVGGYWDGHLFYFFTLGAQKEYLQVRGRWNRSVGLDQLPQVSRLLNTWNAERLWPKGYVREEDGELGIYAEHTVDYEHGLSDRQLDLHLACAISTGLQLFERLDETYPREAAAAKERDRAEG